MSFDDFNTSRLPLKAKKMIHDFRQKRASGELMPKNKKVSERDLLLNQIKNLESHIASKQKQKQRSETSERMVVKLESLLKRLKQDLDNLQD